MIYRSKKNKLLLNNNNRNHIKIMPLAKDLEIPKEEKEQIIWCKEKFEELQNAQDLKTLWKSVNRKKGYLIALYELNNLYYIVISLRNEFNTYNNTIYIHNIEQDSLNICKFLRQNIQECMSDYKKLIIDAREDYVEQMKGQIEKNREERKLWH